MSKDDQPVTSGDFKLLIEEIKKVNASVKNIPTQKGSAVDSIASSIKERFQGIKKNLRNPFEVVTEAIQAPFQAVSGAVESVGEAVMQPFEAFKDVTQGFKNIFSKNTTEKQTELLEQILESINNLNDKFKSDLNRERNQDLTKLEQTKEQASVFKSIASNIKKGTRDGTGRGVKRKGKPGTGGGGSLGVNLLSDFFLAATVSQRGIGDFLKTTGKNLKSATKSLLKVPGALLGGARRFLGRKVLSPIKSLFTDVTDRKQEKFPLRRQAIKDTLKKPFVAVKQAGQRFKERFFPTPEAEQEEFNLTGVAEEKKRKTRSDKGIKRGSYLERARVRKEQEAQQMKFDFPVFDLILRTNQEIVKSSKENTSQLINAITGKGEVIDVDAEVIRESNNLQLESATGEEKGFRRTRSDKGIPRGSYYEARGEKVLNQLEENEQQQELKLSGTDLIVKSNQEIVEAVKANTNSIIKTITGNDLRKAETEKERDKTFNNIADSLENVEDAGGLMGKDGKDGQAGQAGGGDGFLDNALQFLGVKELFGRGIGGGFLNKRAGKAKGGGIGGGFLNKRAGKAKGGGIGGGIGGALAGFGKGAGKGISGFLTGLGRGLKAISNPKYLIGAGVLISLGGALLVTGKALKEFVGIDFKQVALGVTTLGALGVGAALLGKLGSQILIGSLAIAALGASLIPAAFAFNMFSDIDWKSVGIGIATLTALGAAAFGLSFISPAIFIGAAAIAALGAAMIPAAFAFDLFSSALEKMAPALTTLIGSVGDFLTGFIGSLVQLASVGPGLLIAAGGIAAISAALIAFGASSAIGGLLSFFGGDPLKKFMELADKSAGLDAAATAIDSISSALEKLNSDKIDSITDSLKPMIKQLKNLSKLDLETAGEFFKSFSLLLNPTAATPSASEVSTESVLTDSQIKDSKATNVVREVITDSKEKAGFGDEEAISQTTNPVTEITSDAKENRFAASRVAVKDAEAALAKFESENQGAEMVEIDDGMSTWTEYKDPEKQAQVRKLRDNVYDATKERSIASRNVMGLPDYKFQETIGDDLQTIDFIQDRFGINFPGYSESVDGTSSQYIGSGAAIQAAQELFEKNPNATGAEMLQAIQGGNDAAAEMRASMNAAMGQSQNPGIVNAPTSNVQNNSNTIINEAAKHIDRTTQLFGLGGGYQSIPSLDY